MSARVLVLDIERCPMWTKRLPVWDMKGLMNRRLSPDDVDEWGRTICLAYQWADERVVHFIAEWDEGGRGGFLTAARDLYDEADVVVGHNSIGFDTKHLQGEWALEGLTPPSPVKEIDTLQLARRFFNFEANHLNTLTQRFCLPHKTDKYSVSMAMGAVGGDEKAQKRIASYNRGDVRATTALYRYLRNRSNVNLNLFADDPSVVACPKCGSKRLQRRGFAVKAALRYPKFQCQSCGGWSTSKTAIKEAGSVEMRPA